MATTLAILPGSPRPARLQLRGHVLKGKKRCGKKCISKNELCCGNGKKKCGKKCISKNELCCGNGKKKCGKKCISKHEVCCDHGKKLCNNECISHGELCCEHGGKKCGKECIPHDEVCCGSSGFHCSVENPFCTDSPRGCSKCSKGTSCCADGSTCEGDTPQCTVDSEGQTMCCANGQVGCRGKCIPKGSTCCANGSVCGGYTPQCTIDVSVFVDTSGGAVSQTVCCAFGQKALGGKCYAGNAKLMPCYQNPVCDWGAGYYCAWNQGNADSKCCKLNEYYKGTQCVPKPY
ncbi:hypothetical protein HRG_004088 [Hirsutella rhossiliensis]|uniref:Uncharacterized protein n=1 Tax=Hirsutella rhossiliensis TaxID=111463 RepID=A0A9P8N7J6_9HYPO|nr:uncharacterized protein HRG_04088 [Hirsutella rhossiliensis]KAH0966072.1 hypothetical protein HRG_04088 [Hirsutella rhossiliensis]